MGTKIKIKIIYGSFYSRLILFIGRTSITTALFSIRVSYNAVCHMHNITMFGGINLHSKFFLKKKNNNCFPDCLLHKKTSKQLAVCLIRMLPTTWIFFLRLQPFVLDNCNTFVSTNTYFFPLGFSIGFLVLILNATAFFHSREISIEL